MHEEIYIAGIGGQGTLSMGQMLALAATSENKEVSYVPFYGPEKRGGFANCGVTISDHPISSPIISEPSVLVVMNNLSLKNYEDSVIPGGIIILNSSMVDLGVKRSDVRVISIQASEEAEQLGDVRVTNSIILGALIELTGVVSAGAVEQSLEQILPARNLDMIPINLKALERGSELARNYKKAWSNLS
ncbi:MAG TPA: 2-oxoacid:ferredoxin oxidoreductase subunit gamma [Desulfotomaculum sp.]|nr:2-oxoacid:ferredoxin oxidoreductase subunit gamma [Desulfotomaculum sp.]